MKTHLTVLWTVTKPTEHSTLADICFDASPEKIGFQFLGGLKPEHVVAMYTDEAEAKAHAERILAARDRFNAALEEACR